MRNTFRGYFRPSEAQMSELWAEAIIVLDANVLLSLYEYSERTRTELLKLLATLRDRVFLPHQVGEEFHRNRLQRISQASKTLERLADTVTELTSRTSKYLEPVPKPVDRALATLAAFVEKRRSEHTAVTGVESPHDDSIREELAQIFDGRTGSRPTPGEMEELLTEGRRRIEARVPPGYADATKDGDRPCGDYIMWSQVIQRAKSEDKPVILVTEERKEDWWLRHNGKTAGPRPELIDEFFEATQRQVWLYRTESFLQIAAVRLETAISPEAVSEVRTVAERVASRWVDEARRDEFTRRLLAEHDHTQLRVRRGEEDIARLRAKLEELSSAENEARMTLDRYGGVRSRAVALGRPDEELELDALVAAAARRIEDIATERAATLTRLRLYMELVEGSRSALAAMTGDLRRADFRDDLVEDVGVNSAPE